MKTKFRVGDTVKVVKIVDPAIFEKEYLGKTYTIRRVNPHKGLYDKHNYYEVTDLNCCCVFFEEELELVSSNPFTISDLKTGLVVEYANGERALVVNDRLLSDDGYNMLESYNEDLTCDNPCYTINRIYTINVDEVYNLEDFLSFENLELIWERKNFVSEPRKMTKSEIEDLLGYEIEIVAL